jgi:hypothetical protein
MRCREVAAEVVGHGVGDGVAGSVDVDYWDAQAAVWWTAPCVTIRPRSSRLPNTRLIHVVAAHVDLDSARPMHSESIRLLWILACLRRRGYPQDAAAAGVGLQRTVVDR